MDNSLKSKNQNWFLRHKLITVLVVALLGTGIWAAAGQKSIAQKLGLSPTNTPVSNAQSGSSNQTNSNGKSANNSSSSSTTVTSGSGSGTAPGATPASGNYRMTIAGSVATVTATGASVTGHITNNEQDKHSANISATFYGSTGNVVGVATGSAIVQPGQTLTFTLKTSQNVTSYTRMVVQVTSIQ
jgi:cytoskeletal protein RodZ